MQSQTERIDILKFWVYNPATRSPFEVILAIGMTASFKYHEETEVGYCGGTASYIRNDDQVEVVVDEAGTNREGPYSHRLRGKIDFSCGYDEMKMTQLDENFPEYQTPRIKWIKPYQTMA